MKKNKAALVDILHETLGGTKADSERGMEALISAIINTLKDGGEVTIAGLGAFSVKNRAARTARNPRTGEPIEVPAMRVPKFKAAKGLKEAVR